MSCACSYGTCNGCLVKRSLKSGLVFFLVANPQTYKLTSRFFGPWVAADGCPSPAGLFLHTLVFILFVYFLMKLKTKRSGYTLREPMDMSHPASRSSGIAGQLSPLRI